MLIGLGIRDVVLIETLDLSIGPGLTVLTGETGAGKSILLDALGMATGARAEAGLIRQGRPQAIATAVFAPAPAHPVWDLLEERGLAYARDEDLVLRRHINADGRSRAFVNDQSVGVTALREIGDILVEVHGQHETVGLLDAKNHRPLLDAFAGADTALKETSRAWSALRAARQHAEDLRARAEGAAAEIEELTLRLGELDRLAPTEGEETALAEERALLSSAEKALSDIAEAKDNLGGNAMGQRLNKAFRALERARDKAIQAGADDDSGPVRLIIQASEAVDRAASEVSEAAAAVDRAAAAFDFEPGQLDRAEERLFALRAMARKLNVSVDALASERERMAQALLAVEDAEGAAAMAEIAAEQARRAYLDTAATLTVLRQAAAERLETAVAAELPPLKLDKARFRVAVEPVAFERAGPTGMDRIAFEIATNPGAPFGGLGAIASGGELARFALALKASLAGRETVATPLMIFDEVDQGVGGAVADAVGLRLKRLAQAGQVLVVTHSPQVAARGEAHWRVSKAGGEHLRTAVEALTPAEREEEIARMLAGAQITEAARAAARALMA